MTCAEGGPRTGAEPRGTRRSVGLYLHVPFCASKCPYCDFASAAGQDHLSERYVGAVIREIRLRAPGVLPGGGGFGTVYFGGGTPTRLEARQLGRILEAVTATAGWSEEAEVTVETNPGTADSGRFRELRGLGINRLSIGIQSFHDAELRFLGRIHSAEEAAGACRKAREAGFDNVSLDLIFGLPGQVLASWETSLERTLRLGPEHVSTYGLTFEPGTEFGRRNRAGRLDAVPDEMHAAMYGAAMDRLTSAGYRHYEISNFARPGRESRHNLGYWDGSDYLGVGLSAHSYVSGRRSWNVRGMAEYLERMEGSGDAEAGGEIPTEEERLAETVMLTLRRVQDGIPVGGLGRDPDFAARLDRLVSADLLERVGDRARLTRRGLMVADAVVVELVRS